VWAVWNVRVDGCVGGWNVRVDGCVGLCACGIGRGVPKGLIGKGILGVGACPYQSKAMWSVEFPPGWVCGLVWVWDCASRDWPPGHWEGSDHGSDGWCFFLLPCGRVRRIPGYVGG